MPTPTPPLTSLRIFLHAQEGNLQEVLNSWKLHVPHPTLSRSGLLEGHSWGVTGSSSPGLREPKTKGDQPSSLQLKSLQSTGLVWKQGGDLVLLEKNQMALRMEKSATLQSPGSRKTARLRLSPALPGFPWLLPFCPTTLPSGTHSLLAVQEAAMDEGAQPGSAELGRQLPPTPPPALAGLFLARVTSECSLQAKITLEEVGGYKSPLICM